MEPTLFQNSASKIAGLQVHATTPGLNVDDEISKPFKPCLWEDAVDSFISSMIEESKYCSDVMKKKFNKELVITKGDNENFKNSTKCWVVIKNYFDSDVKVRYYCHITGKYRGSAHRDCNINVTLNHKIPIIFHSIKNYDSHLINARTIQIQYRNK